MSSNKSRSALSEFVRELNPPDVSGPIREILHEFLASSKPLANQTDFDRFLIGFTRRTTEVTQLFRQYVSDEEVLGEAILLLERYNRNGGYEGAIATYETDPISGIRLTLETLATAFLSEHANRHTHAVTLRHAGTYAKRKRILEEVLEFYRPHLPKNLLDLPTWVLSEHFFQLIQLVMRIDTKLTPKIPIPPTINPGSPQIGTM